MSFQATFKALSDPTRREILELLKTGPMTAGEIVERFPTTGATVSHHLAVLRGAGLVLDEKKGKYITYELNMTVIQEIMSWAASFGGGDEG